MTDQIKERIREEEEIKESAARKTPEPQERPLTTADMARSQPTRREESTGQKGRLRMRRC